METKKKTLRRPRKIAVKAHQDKVRLAIECSSEERKYIKMFAAHEEMTINEFVLSCVWQKTHYCPYSHIPNEETAKALDNSEQSKGRRSHVSVDEMFKFLGI